MRYIIRQENAEVTYVSGGLFVSNGAWTHPRRILNDYELVIVLKGRFYLSIRGMKKEFQVGDCFLLFPGEEHFGVDEAWDVSFYWLHFKFQETQVLVAEERYFYTCFDKEKLENFTGFILNEYCRLQERARLGILINQLLHYHSEYKRGKGTALPCNLMMEMVLYELSQTTKEINLEKLNAAQKEGSVMDKIFDYIHANYYKDIQVNELANHFGYNQQYFIRMFRRVTGMTPKQYIIQTQVEQAKYLLTTSSMKIMEISKQVGMADAHVFLKHFKKSEGMTPREYRRAFRKTHYNSR